MQTPYYNGIPHASQQPSYAIGHRPISRSPIIREDFSVQSAEEIAHLQTCPCHEKGRPRICWGILKNGDNCSNKAAAPERPHDMPTCGVHRKLAKRSTRCQAQLPCGFQCGRLCLFQVHGFQFCSLHADTSTACYFMKIPLELRRRIYGYLLPSKPIMARATSLPHPRPDTRFSLAILRTNRQIYDEALGLLYGSGSFLVEVRRDGFAMCNSGSQGYNPPTESRNHSLHDYQMQLMLLEQQNKTRLMAARNGHDPEPGPSRLLPIDRYPAPGPMGCTNGPMWVPPVKHFGMIRSFVIEIIVSWPVGMDQYYNHPPRRAGDSPDQLESTLFDFCDQLHRLVGRLRLQPLNHLQIMIRFGDIYSSKQDALVAAQFLLQPFQRLRNVTQPEIKSISIGRDERETFIHGLEVDAFNEYARFWSNDLKSPEPAPDSPLFDAYWQLEQMVANMRRHYQRDPKLQPLQDMLHVARVAREGHDLKGFRDIWSKVVHIWMDYLHHQKEFQSDVAGVVDGIDALLLGGEE